MANLSTTPEVKKTLRKYYVAVYILVAALVIIGLRLITWVAFAPTHPFTIDKLPIPVVKTEAVAGDYVTLDISFCKNTNADGILSTTLVSQKTQLALPVSPERGKKGCYKDAKVPLPIPPQATSDTYHYHFHSVYKLNPLVTISSDFDTANFKVTNPSK